MEMTCSLQPIPEFDILFRLLDKNKETSMPSKRHSYEQIITKLREAEVHPKIAQELARHSSISTTMNFYVGRNAEKAAVLWEARSSDVIRDGKQNRVKGDNSDLSQPQADDEVKKYTRRDSAAMSYL
jgi:hypothetical protein